MKPNKTCIIVNPAAGGGRCGRLSKDAIAQLRASGWQLEERWTNAPGDATTYAREAYADGFRDFIAVGGDGTSFEIVNGLFPEALDDAPPRLGFLPLGTGNSFLRDFGDKSRDVAEQGLRELRTRPVDVMALEHDGGTLFAINILSLGVVADIGATTNRRFKRLGEAGYVVGVVSEVTGLSPAPIPMRVDGGPLDDAPMTFVSFNNSRFTGGKMMMAPDADTGDGEVDVIRAGAMGRFELLRTFPKIFSGGHLLNPKITASRAKEVAFEIDRPVDIMIDGEVLTVRPTALRLLPGALEVRA